MNRCPTCGQLLANKSQECHRPDCYLVQHIKQPPTPSPERNRQVPPLLRDIINTFSEVRDLCKIMKS
jgi:hypothetical protein